MAAYEAGDYTTAIGLLRRMADDGNVHAQNLLGAIYYHGEGVPQDYAAAISWYRKAADQGLAQAQYSLGVMYGKGEGVPQDHVQAHKWFNLAASRYTASQTQDRQDAVKSRDAVAAKMTPAQIAEAQKLAREWKPK